MAIDVRSSELASYLGLDATRDDAATVTIAVPVSLGRRGRTMKLPQNDGRSAAEPEPQQHLVKLILQARNL